MKNIVIAAGYAMRLGELTKNFPMPFLKIGVNTFGIGSLDTIFWWKAIISRHLAVFHYIERSL